MPFRTRNLLLVPFVPIALVGLFLTAFASAAAQTAGAPGKRVALLVGVNRYDKRGFRDLEYAERDVEELAERLQPAGYEVHLLTSKHRGDQRATLGNIQKALAAALHERTKNDLVLVALAGHGLQIEVAGPDGKLRSESFFCPADAEQGNAATMLAMGALFAEIDRRGGGHNLVLVDACREDPTRGRGLDGSKVQALPEGIAVLFGCRAGQRTFETKAAGGGHGVFFHFVLKGLSEAQNERGEVTWARLAEYVSERVADQAPILMGDAAAGQTPNLVANLPGRSPVVIPPRQNGFTPPGNAAIQPVPLGFVGAVAGQVRDDNGLGMKLCWCPPGRFLMGSPASEPSRREGEQQIAVTLSRGFWLGKYEVTQAQWRSVIGSQPWTGRENVRAGADYPAVYVNWHDALKFCEQFSKQERAAGRLPADFEYRLPTEAQWEYACRAGSQTRFTFGDDEARLGQFAWLRANAWDVGQKYAPVGALRANDWGLHDIHGNVWEWCRDAYVEKLSGGADPHVAEAASSRRVVRGGGYERGPSDCRSARREWYPHDSWGSFIGFRVALVEGR